MIRSDTARVLMFVIAALAPLRLLSAQPCEPFWREIAGLQLGRETPFVYALTMWDPDGAGPREPLLVVGGRFSDAGSVPANNIATWDPATGEWAALGAGVNSWVRALITLPDGDLVAAGHFNVAGDEEAHKIARWDGERWHAMGRGFPGGFTVPPRDHPLPGAYALAIAPGGDLVAGGNFFLEAGDPTARHLARWDGETWRPFDQQIEVTGVVYSLKFIDGGDLIAGGYFELPGGTPAENIARWDGAGWNPLGEGLASGRAGIGGVLTLAEGPGGDLIAGGVFRHPGEGEPIDSIARWDGSQWRPLAEGLDNWTMIAAMAILPQPDDSVIVGGWFDHAGGKPALGLARWDGAEWSDLPGAAAIAHALAALPNGDIAVGGVIGSSDAKLAIWGCRECYADCDASGGLDFGDFLCFQNRFAAADPLADCDGSTTLDFFDFLCFQNAFADGCP